MGRSNRDRVGHGLELLLQGIGPFVEREMKNVYEDEWTEAILRNFRRDHQVRNDDGQPHLDVHALLVIMWNEWNHVFNRILGRAERSLVSELRDVRNRWAHQEPFSTDDTYRALDSMARLLREVSATEADEIEKIKQQVLRRRFDEEARQQTRRAAGRATSGNPQAGLLGWRKVITPHPDVAAGRYQQAEFAADLSQVHREGAASEYQDPEEFYARTFLTDGLKHLLISALRRLSGTGGDPVFELQTNFGGGKTHSMLALYHLFSGASPASLPGIDAVLAEAGLDSVPAVARAVIVGTALPPGQTRTKPDGTETRTLWGEIAWQLGGAEGYQFVAGADRSGTSPGSDALSELFNKFGPCLILIDEWVAFVRQLTEGSNLPAGSFEANLTFAQALTEAARRSSNTLVVASLPASLKEAGGELGGEALARLQHTFGRMQTTWRPATAEEGFEIVRRRLFQPIAEDKFAARDATAKAFVRFYREHSQEFPPDAKESEYERRIKAAYPIHPELFKQLDGPWSTIESFQRTRGVLRLMATVIHCLWQRGDDNLLILPGTIPVDDQAVHFELTRYLEHTWQAVLERDVDGPHSVPLAMDGQSENLGRYSASRRVTRTIYLGSAPTAEASNPGIDERSIKLGCTQPGENPAIFGDALRRLTNVATHLYSNKGLYYFRTQPTVLRMAQDRAATFLDEERDVLEELRDRLRRERERGEFAGLHIAPENTNDVPDEKEARLVIFGPEYHHLSGADDSPARRAAATYLEKRGNSPRIYRNMLIFLAPDKVRLDELKEAISLYLAWKSIHEERESLNLTPENVRQAASQLEASEVAVRTRLTETYRWLMVPYLEDPMGDIAWETIRLQSSEPLAVQASRRLIENEFLITNLSGTRLRMELDRHLWREQQHINSKQLWEHLSSYIYLPRLKDENVLKEAIVGGVGQLLWTDAFAYAEGWDEQENRYRGLQAGTHLAAVHLDGHSVLVKPDPAQDQIEKDRQRTRIPSKGTDVPATSITDTEDAAATPGAEKIPEPTPVRYFQGRITLNPIRAIRDFEQIHNEVTRHLVNLVGTEVEINLEVLAHKDDGFSEETMRTVLENARTLGFDLQEFSES